MVLFQGNSRTTRSSRIRHADGHRRRRRLMNQHKNTDDSVHDDEDEDHHAHGDSNSNYNNDDHDNDEPNITRPPVLHDEDCKQNSLDNHRYHHDAAAAGASADDWNIDVVPYYPSEPAEAEAAARPPDHHSRRWGNSNNDDNATQHQKDYAVMIPQTKSQPASSLKAAAAASSLSASKPRRVWVVPASPSTTGLIDRTNGFDMDDEDDDDDDDYDETDDGESSSSSSSSCDSDQHQPQDDEEQEDCSDEGDDSEDDDEEVSLVSSSSSSSSSSIGQDSPTQPQHKHSRVSPPFTLPARSKSSTTLKTLFELSLLAHDHRSASSSSGDAGVGGPAKDRTSSTVPKHSHRSEGCCSSQAATDPTTSATTLMNGSYSLSDSMTFQTAMFPDPNDTRNPCCYYLSSEDSLQMIQPSSPQKNNNKNNHPNSSSSSNNNPNHNHNHNHSGSSGSLSRSFDFLKSPFSSPTTNMRSSLSSLRHHLGKRPGITREKSQRSNDDTKSTIEGGVAAAAAAAGFNVSETLEQNTTKRDGAPRLDPPRRDSNTTIRSSSTPGTGSMLPQHQPPLLLPIGLSAVTQQERKSKFGSSSMLGNITSPAAGTARRKSAPTLNPLNPAPEAGSWKVAELDLNNNVSNLLLARRKEAQANDQSNTNTTTTVSPVSDPTRRTSRGRRTSRTTRSNSYGGTTAVRSNSSTAAATTTSASPAARRTMLRMRNQSPRSGSCSRRHLNLSEQDTGRAAVQEEEQQRRQRSRSPHALVASGATAAAQACHRSARRSLSLGRRSHPRYQTTPSRRSPSPSAKALKTMTKQRRQQQHPSTPPTPPKGKHRHSAVSSSSPSSSSRQNQQSLQSLMTPESIIEHTRAGNFHLALDQSKENFSDGPVSRSSNTNNSSSAITLTLSSSMTMPTMAGDKTIITEGNSNTNNDDTNGSEPGTSTTARKHHRRSSSSGSSNRRKDNRQLSSSRSLTKRSRTISCSSSSGEIASDDDGNQQQQPQAPAKSPRRGRRRQHVTLSDHQAGLLCTADADDHDVLVRSQSPFQRRLQKSDRERANNILDSHGNGNNYHRTSSALRDRGSEQVPTEEDHSRRQQGRKISANFSNRHRSPSSSTMRSRDRTLTSTILAPPENERSLRKGRRKTGSTASNSNSSICSDHKEDQLGTATMVSPRETSHRETSNPPSRRTRSRSRGRQPRSSSRPRNTRDSSFEPTSEEYQPRDHQFAHTLSSSPPKKTRSTSAIDVPPLLSEMFVLDSPTSSSSRNLKESSTSSRRQERNQLSARIQREPPSNRIDRPNVDCSSTPSDSGTITAKPRTNLNHPSTHPIVVTPVVLTKINESAKASSIRQASPSRSRSEGHLFSPNWAHEIMDDDWVTADGNQRTMNDENQRQQATKDRDRKAQSSRNLF